MQAVLQKIIFVSSSVFVLSSDLYDNSSRIQDLVSSFCPYTSFCHSPAKHKTNNQQTNSCCVDCSCEDDCWKYETCCPDKEIIPNNLPVVPCKAPLIKPTKNDTNSSYNWLEEVGPTRYRVEDRCPPGEKNITLIQKCSRPINGSLEDFVWVSDKVSGKIYQNRHCAYCNGVTELTNWLLRIFCSRIMTLETSTILDALLSSSCGTHNEVPKIEEVRAEAFACHITTTNECNMTGLWKTYDAAIAKACKASYWPYFHESTTPGLVTSFRNVFCFLCNSMTVSLPSDLKVCKLRSYSGGRSEWISSFSALLDIDDYLNLNRKTQYWNRCDINEVWDDYMVSCFQANTQRRHYENTPIHIYIENFTSQNWKISDKNSDVFHITAQNIDCGYSLEPHRRGGSNESHNLCF